MPIPVYHLGAPEDPREISRDLDLDYLEKSVRFDEFTVANFIFRWGCHCRFREIAKKSAATRPVLRLYVPNYHRTPSLAAPKIDRSLRSPALRRPMGTPWIAQPRQAQSLRRISPQLPETVTSVVDHPRPNYHRTPSLAAPNFIRSVRAEALRRPMDTPWIDQGANGAKFTTKFGRNGQRR